MIRALRTPVQRFNSCNSNFGISTSSLAEADNLFERNNFNQRSQYLLSSSTIPLYKLIERYKKSRSRSETPSHASIRQEESVSELCPSSETHYDDLARQYAGSSDPKDAKRLHLQIIKNGLVGDLFLPNTLITLYVRTGDLVAAHDLFDEMPERNVVTWTCLISGYAKMGMPDEACCLFRSMLRAGFTPTHYALGNALRACQDSGPRGLQFGAQIHALISKSQYGFDVVVCNGLISMYGSCCLDSAVYAHRVFDGIQMKNSISWNSIISVYSQRGDAFSAFWLFSAMQCEDLGVTVKPSEYTFGSLITASYSTSSKSNHIVCANGELPRTWTGASAGAPLFRKLGLISAHLRVYASTTAN